ncbi:MAG TPA: S8 family peptidase [Methylomirabilota bacterium]|nr:S8 family peptidase [Methylomirabilota bacterium]
MLRQAGVGQVTNRPAGLAIVLLAILLISVYSYSASVRPHTIPLTNEIHTALLLSTHDFTQDEILMLRSLGTVSSVSGPVAVLRGNLIALLKAQELPFVTREESPHLLHVMLDNSLRDLGAQTVWNLLRDSYGQNVTGAGVVIGFVDTGIDVDHPDFKFPNGTTKILYVWDQTISGQSPTGYGYGFECNSLSIQTGACPEVDTFGHGTHVAGIAASSGQATGNYTGVAPGADIIFVKSGYPICGGSSWTFDDAHILDGINYIVKKAHQLGRRAVISLSLGGNIGGHDGSDVLEQALDAIVEDGTPVVVAAGNQARDQIHAHGQVRDQKVVTVNIMVKSQTSDLQIDVWHSSQDEINATLVSPDGHNYPFQTSRNASTVNGNLTVTMTSTNLGREAYFEISSPAALPTTGWSILLAAKEIRMNGIWDSWLDAVSCSFPPAIFLPGNGYLIDPNETIGIPGTAHNVITVGAYVTTATWTGIGGGTYGSDAYQIGQIAPFSSLGPTRDNRTKPDIVAPGMFIASARSSQIPAANSDPDRFHRVLAGTSMAAPHVAGIIALMLQYSPGLSALQIVDILRHSAREDQMTGYLASTGSAIWGFGKADARTATGFYRLSIVSQTLPPSVTIRVLIDNNKVNVPGGSWSNEYFLNGTVHTVAIEEVANTGPVRYLISNRNFTIHQTSIEIVEYSLQYYLEVQAPIVEPTESGWYDANSTVRLKSDIQTSQPLGVKLIRIGWWSSDIAMLSGPTVRLDHPLRVTALYVLTYPSEAVDVILSFSIVVLILLWIRKPYPPSSRERQIL